MIRKVLILFHKDNECANCPHYKSQHDSEDEGGMCNGEIEEGDGYWDVCWCRSFVLLDPTLRENVGEM